MYISYMFCEMTLAFPDDALKFPYELLFLLPCRGKGIPYIQVGVSVSPNNVEDYIYSFAHYLIFSQPSSYKEYNIIIFSLVCMPLSLTSNIGSKDNLQR